MSEPRGPQSSWITSVIALMIASMAIAACGNKQKGPSNLALPAQQIASSQLQQQTQFPLEGTWRTDCLEQKRAISGKTRRFVEQYTFSANREFNFELRFYSDKDCKTSEGEPLNLSGTYEVGNKIKAAGTVLGAIGTKRTEATEISLIVHQPQSKAGKYSTVHRIDGTTLLMGFTDKKSMNRRGFAPTLDTAKPFKRK